MIAVATPLRTHPPRAHVAQPEHRIACPPWQVAEGMDLLGRWLRDCRVSAGMTQAQVARLAGVHQSTLSRLERGALEGLSLWRLCSIISVLHHWLGDRMPALGRR